MAGFVRATKGKQYNESVNQLVESGQQHYLSLRETLHKISTKKGYNQYFESWSPTLNEDTIGQPDLAEMFKSNSLDPRIESVLPILSRFAPKKSEMSEVEEFSDWAENPLEKSVDEAIAGVFGSRRKKYGPPSKPHIEPEDKPTPSEEVSRMRAKNPKMTKALDDLGKHFMDKYPHLRDDVKENDDEHPLYHEHQRIRKERGLPDPEHYVKLKKQKQAEIDALRKEIEADKMKQGIKEEQKDGDYVLGKEKAKNIGQVIGAKSKQHPFKGKLVGGANESADPLINIKKLSGLEK